MENKTVYVIHQAEAKAVADLVREGRQPVLLEVKDPEGKRTAQIIATPEGDRFQVDGVKEFLDAYATAPERREGTARLSDLGSFVQHAVRFADVDSALFANSDPTAPSLTSVLDYHRIGADGAPRYGKHRGVYAFPLSAEWLAWRAQNGAAMDQAKFAEFLENRILDVTDPSDVGATPAKLIEGIGCKFATPSKLLELSRGLSIRVSSKVQTSQNLSTGEASLVYAAQHEDEAGAALKVPGAFLIVLPVFKNGSPYQVAVRLRYRVREGAITWFYELYQADRVFDHAFKEACDLASTATKLPLFLGSPE